MKNLRPIPTLLLIVLSGCAGNGRPATPVPAMPLGDLSPSSSKSGSGLPTSCQKSVYIIPPSATIHVNQTLELSAYRHFPWQGLCYTGPIMAHWYTDGGTLKVISSGKQADFSASKTGSYTVTAIVVRFGQGTAAVTVVK